MAQIASLAPPPLAKPEGFPLLLGARISAWWVRLVSPNQRDFLIIKVFGAAMNIERESWDVAPTTAGVQHSSFARVVEKKTFPSAFTYLSTTDKHCPSSSKIF